MIYLDNAATSYPKPENVYQQMDKCMREFCANPGRGGHKMSIHSGKAVMQARDIIANFFSIRNPMQICFTKNATEAINLGIKGLLHGGEHVITTSMEHNSVIRPLKTLERDIGIEITMIKGNSFGEIDPDDIKRNIKGNTKLIVSTLSSNVNGIIMPVKEIGRIAGEFGIPFMVDASQGAGSIKIDVEEMKIDILAFPGHKGLLGPQGTGGLFVRENMNIQCLIQGGTGSNSENLFQPEFMPDLLESGTLNTPGIVGLGAGIEFINNFGLQNIKQYKYNLIQRLQEGIEELKGVKLYSIKDMEKNSGIVCMNFEQLDSNEVSYVLDKAYCIATRAGLHCAPIAHDTLGTLKTGAVRFSIGCFNTPEDIDHALDALREISMNIL